MDYYTYEERLAYILQLCEKGRFFSRLQAAYKFHCSISTVQRMINHLKKQGFPIKYSVALQRYTLKKK